MKHFYSLSSYRFSIVLVLFSLIASFSCLSQVTGSGSFTFSTSSGAESLSVNVVATSLFDNGDYVYNLSGNTNSDVSFSSWVVESALAVGDFQLDKYGFAILGNPSGGLNAVFRSNDIDMVSASIVDLNGRL